MQVQDLSDKSDPNIKATDRNSTVFAVNTLLSATLLTAILYCQLLCCKLLDCQLAATLPRATLLSTNSYSPGRLDPPQDPPQINDKVIYKLAILI